MPPKKHSPQKRACDACYQRKIQCSFTDSEERCDWCSHRDLECTFDREKPTRKRKRRLESGSTEEPTRSVVPNTNTPQTPIADHILRRNALIESFHRSSTFSGPRNTENIVSANQLSPNWFFNGTSISSATGLQWITSRTDQQVTEMDFCISIRQPPFSTLLEPSNFHDPFRLPEQNVAELKLTALCDHWAESEFPILDFSLLAKTLKVAYEPVRRAELSTRHLSARACVLAFLSMAPVVGWRLEDCGFEWSEIDGDLPATQAHHLLTYLTGDMSLDTLQAVLCLQMARIFNGHWQGAAFLHSIACRIVCSLGGHIYQPIQSSEPRISLEDRETRHIRLLFWLCYMLDKDISLRTGSPPILTDIDCDLTSPETTLDCFAPCRRRLALPKPSNPELSGSRNPCFFHLLSDIRLSMLKEKIYRQLFSAHAQKQTDNQLLHHIRHLDEEIESWRLSIQPHYRPALFVASAKPPFGRMVPPRDTIQRMSLQLEYHHLMTVIHTTVRKCTADTPDGIRDLHDVAHSSFDLSLEASRSTLFCLQVLIDLTIASRAIQFVSLYLSTATLCLFLNIVIHPYDPQARIDLETLMSTANRIRDMRIKSDNKREVDLAREISDFVMRLVWLGTCAVAKVEREKR